MHIYSDQMGLFLDNKFTKCYLFMCYRFKNQNRQKRHHSDPDFVYYESHHIIPRTMQGDDTLNNLVLVTAYEHFILHWLLVRMAKSQSQRNRLAHALRFMRHKNDTLKVAQVAKLYELSKEHISKASSDLNSGRIRSEEFREAMKEKMSGSGNPMYGKTHSPETIEKMAAMKRGVNNPNSDGLTEEHRRKIGNAHRGRPKNELQRETCRDRSKGNKYAVKTLLITLPTGEEITVTDRKRFCAEYGYKYYYIDFALRKGEHNGLRVRYL